MIFMKSNRSSISVYINRVKNTKPEIQADRWEKVSSNSLIKLMMSLGKEGQLERRRRQLAEELRLDRGCPELPWATLHGPYAFILCGRNSGLLVTDPGAQDGDRRPLPAGDPRVGESCHL